MIPVKTSHYYLAHGCGLVACGVCTLEPGSQRKALPVDVSLEGLSLCLEASTQPGACADATERTTLTLFR